MGKAQEFTGLGPPGLLGLYVLGFRGYIRGDRVRA